MSNHAVGASKTTGVILPAGVHRDLRCPQCGASVRIADDVICLDTSCGARYPIVDGIPVLLNERNSVFRIRDFTERRPTYFRPRSRFRRAISAILPSISSNQVARKNVRRFLGAVANRDPQARVLVLGGGIAGIGFIEALDTHSALCCVETDVAFGPRTQLICDGHDIPFQDGTFDGVIAQAVLEHVVNPVACVSEIHRVLKADGLVYAEVPFMQQVHGGAYDFTRFTHLGCLRLFRHFDEVESGIACGPGMALSWAVSYFLMSFGRTARQRMFLRGLGRVLSFFWKWLDPWLVRRPGAFDAASAYYVWGRKARDSIDDRQLLSRYRGLS